MTQRSFRRRQWLRNLFFVAAAGAIGVIAFGARGGERLVLTALDGREAAALCAREGLPLSDFWQRAEVMGLGGVVVREESLRDLARRGRVLIFSREEVEKWRAAGLISPTVPIRPNTIWIKEPAVVDQVMEAAARYGVAATTSTMSGYRLVNLPETPTAMGPLEDAAMGVYDPDVVKSLEGRRLTRIFASLGTQDERLQTVSLRWRGGSAEGMARSGARDESEQRTLEALGEAKRAPEPDWSGRVLEARYLAVDAAQAQLLKTAYSHPARLLVLRLSAPGVEANFTALRSTLQELKRRGLPLGLPAQAPAAQPLLENLQRGLIRLLLWLFGVFGPLLAARAGLVTLKRVRVAAMSHWPVTAPVLQLAAGLAAAGVVAVFVGLAARSCFDSLGFLSPYRGWAHASLIAPLIIALLTLYTIDPTEWRRKIAAPVRWTQLLGGLAALAAAVCLIEPRRLLAVLQLSALSRLPWPSALPWWWDWRWREILVGWPCLLQAFFLVNWRMDCPDCATLEGHPMRDPRSWFLFGLLAPIGIVASVGLEQAPRDAALAQTGWSALAGLVLGAGLVFIRARALHGTKDPEHHRTIDLDVPA